MVIKKKKVQLQAKEQRRYQFLGRISLYVFDIKSLFKRNVIC